MVVSLSLVLAAFLDEVFTGGWECGGGDHRAALRWLKPSARAILAHLRFHFGLAPHAPFWPTSGTHRCRSRGAMLWSQVQLMPSSSGGAHGRVPHGRAGLRPPTLGQAGAPEGGADLPVGQAGTQDSRVGHHQLAVEETCAHENRTRHRQLRSAQTSVQDIRAGHRQLPAERAGARVGRAGVPPGSKRPAHCKACRARRRVDRGHSPSVSPSSSPMWPSS